jgi:thioredoxin 1
MTVDATPETFGSLIGEGLVLVDFWGPHCQPCLALMPEVESLAEEFADRLRLVKVEAPKNREVCRDLKVVGLPAYVLFEDGEERTRLTGDPTISEIRTAVVELIEEVFDGSDG